MQLCSAAAIAGPAPRRWDALQCELKHSCIASTLVPCSCRVYLPNQGAVPGVEHGRCPPIVRRNAKTRAIYTESTTCARLLAVCRTSAAIGGRHSSPNEHCRRTRRLDNARKVHFRHCTLLQLANNCKTQSQLCRIERIVRIERIIESNLNWQHVSHPEILRLCTK